MKIKTEKQIKSIRTGTPIKNLLIRKLNCYGIVNSKSEKLNILRIGELL